MKRNDAIVFVDWDSARRLVRQTTVAKTVRRGAAQTEAVFESLQNEVATHLTTLKFDGIIRVRWRLYHGWYTGKTPTYDHVILNAYVAQSSPRTIGRISFESDLAFSSRMLCSSPRQPLYDTLRTFRDRDSEGVEKIVTRQKMVDTALVCDLLHSYRNEKDTIQVVVGDDDDLLPGIFMAESWGAKVHMLRRRETSSRFVDTRGLVSEIPFRRES
jgi:hypothetical protein